MARPANGGRTPRRWDRGAGSPDPTPRPAATMMGKGSPTGKVTGAQIVPRPTVATPMPFGIDPDERRGVVRARRSVLLGVVSALARLPSES
jgi:hypothetical protein